MTECSVFLCFGHFLSLIPRFSFISLGGCKDSQAQIEELLPSYSLLVIPICCMGEMSLLRKGANLHILLLDWESGDTWYGSSVVRKDIRCSATVFPNPTVSSRSFFPYQLSGFSFGPLAFICMVYGYM